jgi:hypothetical protein
MKPRVIILLLLLPSTFSLSAQNLTKTSGSLKHVVEYQWPMDGNDFVPQRTTFIVRPAKEITDSHTIADISFVVTGSRSGIHNGAAAISDDNRTIIFKPDLPFALDETVSSVLSISGEEIFSIHFHTTCISEKDRDWALYELNRKEEQESRSLTSKNARTILSAPVAGPDTVNGLPGKVVIDTLAAHEENNIFFCPTTYGYNPITFLSIISDTGRNALYTEVLKNGSQNFSMQPDGTLTYFKQLYSQSFGTAGGCIEHLDKNMKFIDTFQCVGYTANYHDFRLLPNGHSLLVAYDPERVNMKVYLDTVQSGTFSGMFYRGCDTAQVFGAVIQELDQKKNLVFQWRSWEHFRITDATSDIPMTTPSIDYMHINTATIDPKDGNIIASFRHQDEIAKLSRTDGSIIWHWGGKHNQFTFSGPNGGDTLKFSHQHDPECIANGDITLFDNGNLHTQMIGDSATVVPSTRAMEYKLDEVNHKATVIWQYDSLPFCNAAGNVQRLDNGNTMIGLGFVCEPSAIEVSPKNEKVFEMSIPGGVFSYRTYRFPFTPPTVTSLVGKTSSSSFGINRVYPNPVQNDTKVSYSVSQSGALRIEVLDVLGHAVRSLISQAPGAGTYSADLDLHDVSNGTYYCKLIQNDNASVKMIVVQK